MKIEITQDKENTLLNRRDILFGVTPEKGVCSRKVVKNKLVALLDTKPGLLILDRMNTQYGMQKVVGYARLYDTVQDLKRIEPAYMIARNAAEGIEETEEADDVGGVEETAATEEVTEAEEVVDVEKVEEAGSDSEEAEEEIEEEEETKEPEETKESSED
ncbi:MAG: hypothetical protein J7J06_08150 [Methanosarcinales archaeon]|nr:hypothetical protein [Methanosarcinales archaeon]